MESLEKKQCICVPGAFLTCDVCQPPALTKQYGGAHYKNLIIQPVEYCQKNKLGYCESSAIKYLTRWRDKGGIEDLEKAKHFIDILIEFERSDNAS